ncbi:MAG: ribosome biogenesis GTPase Der, partial [Geminicoccaceae bacterium]|nr:ribosome biogenesis GTPase Der [Geminicoccaceae bacterium]
VGKSTLFNRLTRSRRALVHDTPGLTRDRIEGRADFMDLDLDLVDTAGLEVGLEGPLSERLVRLGLAALERADAALFLVDARAGITAMDEEIADLLRRQTRPIVLVANKCEGRAAEADALDAWRLGLGEPLMLSGEHGIGLDALAERLQALMAAKEGASVEPVGSDGAPGIDEEPEMIRLAIVGRPNAGKSSLINRLLGEERQLTGPEPGLTRDSVGNRWHWRGRAIELVDTAGLRRKARIETTPERLSASVAVRAIREAHVVLLMLDATQALEKQDFTIANLALDEGRALVVGINKWDLVEDGKELLAEIRFRLKHRMSQVPDVPFLTFSVLQGRGLAKLMPTIVETFERWSTRISTGRLNRWLVQALSENPPPMAQNRRIKMRYATQVASRPPTIAIFANKPADDIPASYMRYLTKSFAAHFALEGVLVRIVVRHGDNPYHEG